MHGFYTFLQVALIVDGSVSVMFVSTHALGSSHVNKPVLSGHSNLRNSYQGTGTRVQVSL